jgi:hypothetical protein
VQAESSLSNVCRGIAAGNSSAVLEGVKNCPPENTTALSTGLAQAGELCASQTPLRWRTWCMRDIAVRLLLHILPANADCAVIS